MVAQEEKRGPEMLPEDLRAIYPFASHRYEQPAGSMHYLDEGDPKAPALVCVHGNPTWSFYFRRIALAFRDRFRVIVPDHLGCGLSGKPQIGFGYRLQDHIDNLRRLLDHLGVNSGAFMLHDWGGAIGMGVLTEEPDRASAIVVSNTAAFRSRQIPASIASVRIPGFGAVAVRGFNAFARLATVRASEQGLSPLTRKGLLFPYDSWAHRIAVLRFVQDIPMAETHPSWPTLLRIEERLPRLANHPMLLLWGDADFCFDIQFRREWQTRFPGAQVVAWPDVGHYVLEDAPDRAIEAVGPFLSAVRRPHEAPA